MKLREIVYDLFALHNTSQWKALIVVLTERHLKGGCGREMILGEKGMMASRIVGVWVRVGEMIRVIGP